MGAIVSFLTGNLEWVASALTALAAAWGMSERSKRKQSERNLKASQDIRKKEKEVRDESDDDLADRISR